MAAEGGGQGEGEAAEGVTDATGALGAAVALWRGVHSHEGTEGRGGGGKGGIETVRYREGHTHSCTHILSTSLDLSRPFSFDLSRPLQPTGAAALYGVAQSIPDRSIIDDIVRGFLDTGFQTSPHRQNE